MLGYFLFGAFVGAIIGYVTAALLALTPRNDEEDDSNDRNNNF